MALSDSADGMCYHERYSLVENLFGMRRCNRAISRFEVLVLRGIGLGLQILFPEIR